MDVDLSGISVKRVFDYDRLRLPNEYLAQVDSQSACLKSSIVASGLSMGYPAWNLLYYTFTCSLPPDTRTVNVVETGTNAGYSTIVLAQALKDRGLSVRVQTVDSDPRAMEVASENVAKAGLSEFVDFHLGDSCEFLRQYVAGHELIHFAFLDSCHEREHVIEEFRIIFRYLKPYHSTVFFDNTSDGGVAEALDIIKKRFGGNLVEFANCSWGPPGNAIWQPKQERPEPA